MRIQKLLCFGLIFITILSCKISETIPTNDVPGNVIATIADEPVTIEELKTNLNRNRNSEEIDSTEILEFYPSYINYRLKLYEGYQKGFHRDSTILAEFNEYASEIANRFWIENEIKRERIETFKNRFNHELKAFHILKELPEAALPGDTIEVYNTLVSVRDSLLNGENLELMNERHSSKREGRPVGGQLSWITAGTTIESFKNALYNLEPGEISPPVRSQFGYHLILLQEKRPRTAQRQIKHIFIRKKEDGNGRQKINRAYRALKADSSWSDVLKNYTEDTSTQNRNGTLGWVGYGARFPAELVEFAMQTSPESAYSEPYEASYGYHIMKVDSVRSFKNEEQKEEFIVNRLENLGRLNPDQKDLYNRIAEESNLTINRENFSELLRSGADSSGSISPQSENSLIEFNNKTYTWPDFQYWLDNVSSDEEVMQSGNIIESYRDYLIQQNLVDYTRTEFPEFAEQVDHFLEGLIVFKVNEENIWNPEEVDRARLQAFYESNQQNYRKGKTYHYSEISAPSDSIMQDIYRDLSNGFTGDEISERFNEVSVHQDSTYYPQNPAYSILETLRPGEFSEPTTVSDRVFIYILRDANDERTLSFDEAFDRVFTDYQPIREENFMNQLKSDYNLQLYPENL
ncbi:MAG: peptidylprolyl isomerase [Balneolaceae bacterium]|nr:peptidylprolyl isomerase [Balneolaceae bacterium]